MFFYSNCELMFQVYEEYAEQADMWLASKEAFLANEDLGVSAKNLIVMLWYIEPDCFCAFLAKF